MPFSQIEYFTGLFQIIHHDKEDKLNRILLVLKQLQLEDAR